MIPHQENATVAVQHKIVWYQYNLYILVMVYFRLGRGKKCLHTDEWKQDQTSWFLLKVIQLYICTFNFDLWLSENKPSISLYSLEQ